MLPAALAARTKHMLTLRWNENLGCIGDQKTFFLYK